MKQLIPLLLLAFLLPTVNAATLEYYGIEATIQNDLSVRNVITFRFNETVPTLDYQLNFDIYDLEVNSTLDEADCSVVNRNAVSCTLSSVGPEKDQLTLSFLTTQGVTREGSKYTFTSTYGFLPTDRTFVLIRLPQYSILSEEDPSTSYTPSDGKIISDGKTISLFWERQGVQTGSTKFSVSYLLPQGPNTIVLGIGALVLIGVLGALYMYFFRRKTQHPADVISSVLNADEKMIIDILKRNEGKALQKILVRESSFSKAKVSRLVKELKGRGIVSIEPVSGRENRILLTVGEEKPAPVQQQPTPQTEQSPPS